MFVHEDSRRKLIEWASGSFQVAKALVAKCCCSVGDHYHRHKDESFLLLSGRASVIIVGDKEWRDVSAPFACEVPRNTYHRFDLEAGSVLLGTGTEAFDPMDEIPGRPGE